MKRSVIVLSLLLVMVSCSDNKNEEPVDNENETPEILQDDNKGASESTWISKSTRSYDKNLIEKLFDEAMEKDAKLKELVENIKLMNSIKYDSLDGYNSYVSTNSDYWSNVDSYVQRLSDSTLKESTMNYFSKLEANYRESMTEFDKKIEILDKRTINLSDQLILMQLMVTQPMMYNYQVNEKPSIELLDDLINDYDNLIEESKQYTK